MGAVAHAAAAVAIVSFLIVLWRPDEGAPPLGGEQETRIAELVTGLDERRSSDPAALARRLEALTRFPPSAGITHALAASLIACDVADLGEPDRMRLARGLNSVMNGGHLTAGELARVLDDIQRAATIALCEPGHALALARSARLAARDVPNPRRDWW